jgi:hypothetical protein
MEVKEIVKKYLEDNGFDGLFFPGECGCMKDELMPCENMCADCEAGYLINEDTPGIDKEKYNFEEYTFYIVREKPCSSQTSNSK